MEINKIIYGDCLEAMEGIPDKSINLIIADPPYNINKADWDKIPNYIEWLGSRLLEMQRALKDNGSFYLFHNDFLQMVEIQNWINKNSKFVFKQLIVWNKKFKGCKEEGYLQGFNETNQLRNYQKMAEYILFYTLQSDDYIREYFRKLLKERNLKPNDFNKFMWKNKYCKSDSNIASHIFGFNNQIDFPTEKMQGYLKEFFNIGIKPRYTYNNQKTHHSVWNYDVAERVDHITPKPIPLIKNILRHSSNEGDIVLIPFAGSGNDCIACKELKRNYIGIEDKENYCEIARNRIKAIPELLF